MHSSQIAVPAAVVRHVELEEASKVGVTGIMGATIICLTVYGQSELG